MGFGIGVAPVFGKFDLSYVRQPYAGNSVGERGSPSLFYNLVDIGGRAYCHVHDGMYPFEFSVVSFDVVLEVTGCIWYPSSFSLRFSAGKISVVITSSWS